MCYFSSENLRYSKAVSNLESLSQNALFQTPRSMSMKPVAFDYVFFFLGAKKYAVGSTHLCKVIHGIGILVAHPVGW